MTREQYIDTVFKTYRLVSVLSDRNGGRVYRLRHRTQEKDIVLRSFATPVVAYEVLRDVRSQNLPEIYDTIALEDGQIVLEEYIDGVTVAQVMESGHYHPSGAKRVLSGVCRALSVLHSLDLVHRDVKPENVLVTAAGRVVLIDFNASRKVAIDCKDTAVMGTVGYVSPEQLGVSQSDSRTDVYAVGVLLNVMMTGKHPSEQLARGHAGRLVRKCTNINPGERFQTAEQLLKAL